MADQILVVEDEPSLLDLLRRMLSAQGFDVLTAADGTTALQLATASPPDLVLLDLILPDTDGMSICRALRADARLQDVPIIMVTAMHEIPSRVAGLDAGADDYITKPFDYRELIARVRACLRSTRDSVLSLGELRLVRARQELQLGSARVALTGREFALLDFLAQHPNELAERHLLLEAVWGADQGVESNVLDVYVRRLRRKLSEVGFTGRIRTVRAHGYVLELPAGWAPRPLPPRVVDGVK